MRYVGSQANLAHDCDLSICCVSKRSHVRLETGLPLLHKINYREWSLGMRLIPFNHNMKKLAAACETQMHNMQIILLQQHAGLLRVSLAGTACMPVYIVHATALAGYLHR